jgi:hypothetical protein
MPRRESTKKESFDKALGLGTGHRASAGRPYRGQQWLNSLFVGISAETTLSDFCIIRNC